MEKEQVPVKDKSVKTENEKIQLGGENLFVEPPHRVTAKDAYAMLDRFKDANQLSNCIKVPGYINSVRYDLKDLIAYIDKAKGDIGSMTDPDKIGLRICFGIYGPNETDPTRSNKLTVFIVPTYPDATGVQRNQVLRNTVVLDAFDHGDLCPPPPPKTNPACDPNQFFFE